MHITYICCTMKKAAILCMLAFYLLLTTGMYVCLLHCSSEMLVAKSAMHMPVADPCQSQDSGHGKTDKAHSCKKNHGNYVIKENLETKSDIQFAGVWALSTPLLVCQFAVRADVRTSVRRADCGAPPWQSGKSRTIRFRSIQI